MSTKSDYDEMLNRIDVRGAEFEVLFEQSIVGICYVAPDGTFLRVNQKFAEILGYSRKELEGKKSWPQVTHPEDVVVIAEEMKDVAADAQDSFRIHKRYLSKDGSSVYCEVKVNRIEDEDNIFVHFLKQIQELKVPDSNLTVVKDRNGNPILQPVVPIQEFLLRNWKWVAGTLGPLLLGGFGWAGNTASNYYEVKAKYEVQQERIQLLQDTMDKLKSQPK